MKNTQYKMDEAQFFLEELRNNRNLQPQFNYYLNAFISSARAVLWVMNNEYNKVEGWREWYNQKQVSPEDESLLEGIVEMRNHSLKSIPPRVVKTFYVGNGEETVSLSELLDGFIGKRISFKIETCNEKRNLPTCVKTEDGMTLYGKVSSKDTVKEFKDKDVVEVCENYMAWLQGIISECFELFG